MQDRPCPFCPINERRIIEVRQRVVVALSNPRLMPGHTLVIPKRHVDELITLTGEERHELIDTVAYYEQKIKAAFGPGAGCTDRHNDMPFMPKTERSVPEHLHWHILPRSWCDEYYEMVMKYETGMFKPLSEEESERMRTLLAE